MDDDTEEREAFSPKLERDTRGHLVVGDVSTFNLVLRSLPVVDGGEDLGARLESVAPQRALLVRGTTGDEEGHRSRRVGGDLRPNRVVI